MAKKNSTSRQRQVGLPALIQTYYADLRELAHQRVFTEMGTRNAFHTLLLAAGIPPEAFGYRVGNRSALEWVIDQYQVCTDKRSGITSDPNRADDEQYIVRLVGQVIRVSLETMRIVAALPAAFADGAAAQA